MNVIIESILISCLVWIVISIGLCALLGIFYENKCSFTWFDFWIGIYYNRTKKILYINPFPTIVYEYDLTKRKEKEK